MEKVKAGEILLAFCWTHVRRDFLDVARDWEQLESWGLEWVEAIGNLFHLNAQRLEVQDELEAFAERDAELRQSIAALAKRRDEELAEPELHPARKKALQSLRDHWPGLVLFLDHPEIPMDNSEAERRMIGPAICRKNFYGSGAEWSGELAVRLFALFATLQLWKINPRKWLYWYLDACAQNGGRPAEDVKQFLPWNLAEEKQRELALAPPVDDSS